MTHDFEDRSILVVRSLARRWWALVIRGLAAIAFGALALRAPERGLLTLVTVWGVYAVVEGVLSLSLALRGAHPLQAWAPLVFEGATSITAGVLMAFWPTISSMALLVVMGVWGLLTGAAEATAAIRLRRYLRGESLLATSGVCSMAFGVTILIRPGPGALALFWLLAVYAIAFGALHVALGVRLRRWEKIAEHPVPTGGVPRHE